MEQKPYKTVRAAGVAEHIERHSRFIAYVYPCQSEEQALIYIDEVRQKHPDATHHVHAYTLKNGIVRRFFDDGEPKGTAGLPVIDVLTKQELEDALVVVVRYFGGILLGAGGLVRAYSQAARLGILAAGVCEMESCGVYSFAVGYAFFERVKLLLEQLSGDILTTEFGGDITVECVLPDDKLTDFTQKLEDVIHDSVKICRIKDVFRPKS